MTDSNLICFVIGNLMILSAVFNSSFPPKSNKWWSNGVRYSFAMRNEETFQEANHFLITPKILVGLVFNLAGILPVVYTGFEFLNEISPLFFILVTHFVMASLTKWHLNKIFDENGIRK